jgi:preprotein translocase subunit SecG
MSTVLLIIHLFVTLALIGVVLIQRSEGGGLGIGTSQGMGSFMSGRGTANLLTRTTAILATMFMVLALALALLDRGANGGGRSMLDIPGNTTPVTPAANPTPTDHGTAPSAKEPALPGASVPGANVPPAPAQPAPATPSTAPGSAAAPTPAPSPGPAAPAPGSSSSPSEPAVPGAAPSGSAAPKPPSGAPAVPTN